jgi:hypothetical protein
LLSTFSLVVRGESAVTGCELITIELPTAQIPTDHLLLLLSNEGGVTRIEEGV